MNYGSIGPIIGELSKFFKNAERTLPKPGENKVIKEEIFSPSLFDDSFTESKHNIHVLREKIKALDEPSIKGEPNVIKSEVSASSTSSLVTIHKRERLTTNGSSTEIKRSKMSLMTRDVVEISDESEGEVMIVEPTVVKMVPSERMQALQMVRLFWFFCFFKYTF